MSCRDGSREDGKVRHHVAAGREWPWLPTRRHGHLAKHPWCQECGAVAAVGGERALPLGGITNLLARLERRFAQHGIKFTEAQRRLVIKKIQDTAADDSFGQRREEQVATLSALIGRYVGVAPETVETYVRSC